MICMEKNGTTIEDLGWDDFFAPKGAELEVAGFAVARVIAEQRGVYRVKNGQGEFAAKVTGKRMHQSESRQDYPVVGDWVVISLLNDEQAIIQKVLPRKTLIRRRSGDKNRRGEKQEIQVIAANVDVALIVQSPDRDFVMNRLERYVAMVRDARITPVVVLNKADLLCEKDLAAMMDQMRERLGGVDIIPMSVLNGEGLDALEASIQKGKTYCFLGSSGVGKSSLINALLKKNMIKTGAIGTHAFRGTHTTTSRQMYFLTSGGMVIDNPGIREVGMVDACRGIDDSFDDVAMLAQGCKYANCTHVHEPGCAVLAAVGKGELDAPRYANYVNLKREAEYGQTSERKKQEKDRKFGKFLKKAKKGLHESGHKDY